MRRIPVDDPRWLEFVSSRRDAGPFHHPAWARVIARCYGFSAFALVELDEHGLVMQGLPIVEVGGRLQRRAWVSLPYSDHVPALLSTGSPAIERFLAGADEAWRDLDLGYLQVRGAVPGYEVRHHQSGVIHTLELGSDPHTLFRRFERGISQKIRRAERDKLVTVRRGERHSDLTEIFYALHLRTRRRQGSPVQPKRFFRLLWDEFISPGMGFVLLAYHGREPIAGAVYLAWNRILIAKLAASNPAALRLRPNHLIIWHAIQGGCKDGMRLLDFGRSDRDNQGLRGFKSHWGATERPLVYTTMTDARSVHQVGRAPRLLQMTIRRSPPILCRAAGELLYRYAA